jgi:hypothetical protein
MAIEAQAKAMLAVETRSMLARLAMVKPFALQESMLPAASLLPSSQIAIEKFLIAGRERLRRLLVEYLQWLQGSASQAVNASEAQKKFVYLRLRFNAVLIQFDLFADVITQRSETDTGVWLSGLDVVATDALGMPGYYEAPPVICYLDRDIGAAIRRARTRLPGGGENPVAIVRIPRERMVGSGIASSLVHEVGHQAAALLDLVNSLRQVLKGMQGGASPARMAWQLWDRWISEIVSDFWSVARVGIASTIGLMGVVSLPRAFVFRLNTDDPHPAPWIRVKLSSAIGEALFPHPQWGQLSRIWESYYPPSGLGEGLQNILAQLLATLPSFVSLLVNHRPKSLRGASLREALKTSERQPTHLSALYQQWTRQPTEMYRAVPTLAFAVLGQARANQNLSPEAESHLLGKLLSFWALRATLDSSQFCAAGQQQARALAA